MVTRAPLRPVATTGPVLVVGTGLLGTSVGLALSAAGVDVLLSDSSPTSQRLAVDVGAGRPVAHMGTEAPRLVVVATPPDVAGACVVDALVHYPGSVVTDVASVKSAVVRDVLREAELTDDPAWPPATWAPTRWRGASAPVREQPMPISSPVGPGWSCRSRRPRSAPHRSSR